MERMKSKKETIPGALEQKQLVKDLKEANAEGMSNE